MAERAKAILIIDDESQARRAVASALNDADTRVIEAATGSAGIDLAAAERPDLIVLDLGLPDIEGIEVCREIRNWCRAPIIVVSARHEEDEKVALLSAGADDFITKPFSLREFVARVRVQLRRHASNGSSSIAPIEIDGVRIDFRAHHVTRDGKVVHLTPLEWRLLAAVASQAGRMLTHQQIYDSVWGREFGNPQQHLRVHIWHLRRKIEPDPLAPVLIVTEAGVGYRFQLPEH